VFGKFPGLPMLDVPGEPADPGDPYIAEFIVFVLVP
jgi:hypothetical protein